MLALILLILAVATELTYRPRLDTTDYNDLLLWYNGHDKREFIKLL